MKLQHRVVWSRGMFLMPQHLQAQDDFLTDEFRFRSTIAGHANWGLWQIAIDEDAIANRVFRLLRCEGMMEDGCIFSLPDSQPLPAGRSFDTVFPANQELLDVYLVLPEKQLQSVSNPGDPFLRYRILSQPFWDQKDGQEEPIEVAQPNFELRFGAESRVGMTWIRIAQIVRLRGGTCRLNPTFIPASLSISASSLLVDQLLSAQMEILTVVSNELSAARGEQSEFLADFTGSDIQRFWVLHIANRALPELKHLQAIRHVHPEHLYRFMLRLGGALCTFSLEVRPLDFLNYDHQNLGVCFRDTAQKIERMIKAIVWPPAKCTPIPLEKVDLTWAGRVKDEDLELLESAEFYLVLRSQESEVAVVPFVQGLNVKVCGSQLFPLIESNQLTGASLHYVGQSVLGCPSRLGSDYFKIIQHGNAWTDIHDSHEFRILLMPGLRAPVVELFAVRRT